MRSGWLFITLTFLCLAPSAGCDSDSPSVASGDQEILAENRERFQARVGTSYDYEYSNVCFCLVDLTRRVRITVRGGAVTSVTDVETGAAIQRARWDDYSTVAEIFDTLERAFDEGAASVRVTYDSELGYPRDVFIDFDERIADEERGFVVENLVGVR